MHKQANALEKDKEQIGLTVWKIPQGSRVKTRRKDNTE